MLGNARGEGHSDHLYSAVKKGESDRRCLGSLLRPFPCGVAVSSFC